MFYPGYPLARPIEMNQQMYLDSQVFELFQMNNEEDPTSQVAGLWLTFHGEIYEATGLKDERNH